MAIRCKAGSKRPISDLNGVGRRVGEMEEDPAPLKVRPHLGAGLHALVLKPQLLHPNLTYSTIGGIQDKRRIVEYTLQIRSNSLISTVYHHHVHEKKKGKYTNFLVFPTSHLIYSSLRYREIPL